MKSSSPAGRAADRVRGVAACRVALLVACAGFVACDIPTASPRFIPRFLISAAETALPVAQVLPSSVTIAVDGEAFAVGVPGVTFDRSLAQLCPSCPPAAGPFPKPAFTAELAGATSLPSDVASAQLASGVLAVRVENRLGFDPIRPSPTARGRLTLEVTAAGRVLGSALVAGEEQALAHGESVTRAIPLEAGTLSGPITVRVMVESPAGDPITPASDARLIVELQPATVLVSEGVVHVPARAVEVESRTIDLTGVDATVRDRVRGGAVVLLVENPFAITGRLRLRLAASASSVEREIGIGTGTQRVPLTGDELRSLLGDRIEVSAAGPIDAASGVRVRPDDRITLLARLEVSLEVGGREP
jgi:hypothetical protein